MNENIPETTGETTDDLAAFEQEFYQTEAAVEEKTEETPVEETDEEDLAPAEEAEETTEEEEEEKPQPKKPRKSAEERIREVVAKEKEAERREQATAAALELALKKIEELSNPNKPANTQANTDSTEDNRPNPNALGEDGGPKYALGEFDPDYLLDLNKFLFQQEMNKFREEQERTATEQKEREAYQAVEQAWQTKVAAAETTLPDLRDKVVVLDEITQDLPQEQVQFLASTIMAMDAGPEVLYYLADNPEEATKIATSDPRSAALALGRLEGSLLASKPVKGVNKTRVTAATPPPTVQTKGAGSKLEVAADTEDLAAFEKAFYKK